VIKNQIKKSVVSTTMEFLLGQTSGHLYLLATWKRVPLWIQQHADYGGLFCLHFPCMYAVHNSISSSSLKLCSLKVLQEHVNYEDIETSWLQILKSV
jgi:hypothetical protein